MAFAEPSSEQGGEVKPLKKITVRKAGSIRLTAVSLYGCCCA
jgi:hypothetical protein